MKYNKYSLDQNTAKFILTKSYSYPHVHKEQVKPQVNQINAITKLNRNIHFSLFLSCLGFSQKIYLSEKPKWRVVIDERNFIEFSVNGKFPLLKISGILDPLENAHISQSLNYHYESVKLKNITTIFSLFSGK